MKKNLMVAPLVLAGLASLFPFAPTRLLAADPLVTQAIAVEIASQEALASLEEVLEASGITATLEPRGGDWVEVTVSGRASEALETISEIDAIAGEVLPDVTVKPFADPTPNDPLAGWNLADSRTPGACTYGSLTDASGSSVAYRDPNSASADCFGAGVARAWTYSRGSGSIIAIIDTGITTHPDLPLPVGGYDFVSSTTVGNDGDGRDGDPSDPGDWCGSRASGWHGTHVAGIALARTDDGLGIAGVAPAADLLAIRALGACGGSLLDVADAIRWAAGLEVPGVPLNSRPADVINLSLGGKPVDAQGRFTRSCPSFMGDAVNAAIAAGSIVVAAAGNEGATSIRDASYNTPANCPGVITVGATGNEGDRAGYSSTGSLLVVSAQGGYTSASYRPASVMSSVNAGTQSPTTPSWRGYQGTSMAAPHVAGALALLRARDRSIDAARARELLIASAAPFGLGAGCAANPGYCGAGILDAGDLLFSAFGAGETTPSPEPTPTPTPEPTPAPAEPADDLLTFDSLEPIIAGAETTIVARALSGLPVTIVSTTPSICTVSEGRLSALHAGRCDVRASTDGSSAYRAVSAELSISIGRRTATVEFLGVPDELFLNAELELVVRHSAGLPVTVSSLTPGVCTVGESRLYTLVTGECEIKASALVSGDWSATSTTARISIVAPARLMQAIDLELPDELRLDGSLLLKSHSDAGLPLDVDVETSETCLVDGFRLIATAPGLCRVTASQAGDSRYLPVTETHLLTITRLPGFAVLDLPTRALAGGWMILESRAASGPLTWSSETPAICSAVGTILDLLTAGDCRLIAVTAQTGRHAAAIVRASIAVDLRTPDIDLLAPANMTVGDTASLTASVDTGSALEILLSGPCSLDPLTNTIRAIAGGICEIRANSAATAIYAAGQATVSISIAPAGAISLAGGLERTASRTVSLGAVVPSWATSATISWNGARATTLPLSTKSVTLPSGDRLWTATVVFSAGNRKLTVSDSIILDTTGPLINTSVTRLAVGSASLTVALSDAAGVNGYRISIGGTTKPGAWLNSASLTVSGIKGAAIYVQSRDALGNLSAWKKVGVLPSR